MHKKHIMIKIQNTGGRMYYNIVLNSLNKKTDPQALKIISKLACENRDLIEARTFPTIICRYATPDEVSFYKELQEKYSLDLVFKEIKTADNVFELFNAELKQGEQEDIHLKDKPEIINRLQDGLDVLEEKEACEDDFNLSSEMIKSKIRERKEVLTSKFKPLSIYFVFVMWAAVAVLLSFSQMYDWPTKIFVMSCIFCVAMAGAIIYDYIRFKKKKTYYSSEDYYLSLIQDLTEENHKKNLALHRIENMIDTLQARTCLTLLSTEKRNVETVKEYLVQLNTLKSINEIFSLH